MMEHLESGKLPSVRGIVKCLKCKHYQVYISQIVLQMEKGFLHYGITKQMRSSICRNCQRRNRFTMTLQFHQHRGRKKPVFFTRMSNITPRETLTNIAQMNNRGSWDGILSPTDMQFKTGDKYEV